MGACLAEGEGLGGVHFASKRLRMRLSANWRLIGAWMDTGFHHHQWHLWCGCFLSAVNSQLYLWQSKDDLPLALRGRDHCVDINAPLGIL